MFDVLFISLFWFRAEDEEETDEKKGPLEIIGRGCCVFGIVAAGALSEARLSHEFEQQFRAPRVLAPGRGHRHMQQHLLSQDPLQGPQSEKSSSSPPPFSRPLLSFPLTLALTLPPLCSTIAGCVG